MVGWEIVQCRICQSSPFSLVDPLMLVCLTKPRMRASYMKTQSSVAACCVIGYSMSFWALIHDDNVPFPLRATHIEIMG